MTFMCGGSRSAPDDALRVLSQLATCCIEAAVDGPAACTCWTTTYDLDQALVDEQSNPTTRATMCADCAYRPSSPERRGDPRHEFGDPNDELPDGDVPFWCHQGMRKAAAYTHRLGISVQPSSDYYNPPRRVVDGAAVPYRADGSAAERCAGWAAARARRSAAVAGLAAEASA